MICLTSGESTSFTGAGSWPMTLPALPLAALPLLAGSATVAAVLPLLGVSRSATSISTRLVSALIAATAPLTIAMRSSVLLIFFIMTIPIVISRIEIQASLNLPGTSIKRTTT
ncbi:hypothetical protein D3C76_1544990 [compost metagenome]